MRAASRSRVRWWSRARRGELAPPAHVAHPRGSASHGAVRRATRQSRKARTLGERWRLLGYTAKTLAPAGDHAGSTARSAAGLDLRRRLEEGQPRDAEARQRRAAHERGVVGDEAARDGHAHRALGAGEDPGRGLGQLAVENAVVLAEIAGRLGLAAAREVGRAGREDEPRGPQAPHEERRLHDAGGDADGDVEALAHQVDATIGEDGLDARARVRGEEVGHHLAEEGRAEGDRRGDAEEALRGGARGRHGGVGLLGLGDDPRAALVVGLAQLGRLDGARGALEQAYAELRLELGDLAAHRRLGLPQHARRAGEAPVLHDPGEDDHAVEIDLGLHALIPPRIDATISPRRPAG